MMLKQSSSRNLRGGRGYKIKHVAQMCLMLAVTLWMLYQLRHCHFKKAALEETKGRTGEAKAGDEKAVVKLGRKGLLPGVVEEEDEEEAKGVEEGRGDEFEQVDDMMEESDEQEMDDKQQDNQNEDVLAEKAHQEEQDRLF